MARARNKINEPVEAATSTDSKKPDKSEDSIATSDSITDSESVSSGGDDEVSESQSFRADGKYKQVFNDNDRHRHWLFIVYEDSAPSDWIDRLENTGLPFTISPYHDKDKNPDSSPKKAHWHVIVSYNNNTTYHSVKALRETVTKGPFPLPCRSVSGSYAYFTHKHNPEKYQYDATEIRRFNGWEKVLEASDVHAIMIELTNLCISEDIYEYADLMVVVLGMDGDYVSVAMSHTLYFSQFLTSYRHNPIAVLHRLSKTAKTDEERKAYAKKVEEVAQRIRENQKRRYEDYES